MEVMSGFWRKNFWSSQKTTVILWTHTENVACLKKDLTAGTKPGQRRGRQRRSWLDYVKARTELRLEKAVQAAADQKVKKAKLAHLI